MKRTIIVMALMAMIACLNARTLDRAAMKEAAKSEGVRCEELMVRFIAGDATLTPEEVNLVYYGYSASPQFRANAAYPMLDKAFEAHDYTKALDMARLGLSANPVSLPLLFKAYACASVSPDADTKAKAKVYQTRINQICDAIFESGKGVSTHSPYVLLRASDIDPFINNYLQPIAVMDRSKVGNQLAVKMQLDGMREPVILYFDVL